MGRMDAWDRVFSRAVDLALNDRVTGVWRAAATHAARGIVLELGFGSGANLAYLPESVTEVWAVDPSDAGWERAEQRIREFGRPVRRVALDAAHLPVADDSVDSIISTWTMCTISDLAGALAEAMRVLRPGGELLFVEHSLAPSPTTARLQRAIQPTWGRLAGGCHLDRDLPGELRRAGWSTSGLDERYVTGFPPARPWAWFISGRASHV